MILTAAAFLTAVGFLAFAGGMAFGYRGVAVIGGTLVFGVGVMFLGGGGLEIQHGVHKVSYATNNTTVVTPQYRSVNTPTTLSLGFLFSMLGGALVLRGIGSESG